MWSKDTAVRNSAKSILLAGALLTAACAKPPDEIEPDFSQPLGYIGVGCSQLVEARSRVAQKLIFAGLQQDRISRDDRIRFLGIPTLFGSVFEGSVEPKVARLKAELRLVKDELNANKCPSLFR